MGTQSEELKAQIDGTRADLTETINAMGDKVSPGRIVARRRDKARQKVSSLRDTIMGAADRASPQPGGISNQVSGSVGSAMDSARQAPENVVDATRGNPLAAGLIAFGVGALGASVFPVSRVERQATSQVLDKAQPAIHQARDAAQAARRDLKGSALGAAEEVRSAAANAVGTVQDQAKSSAGEVRSAASGASSDLKDRVRGSASTLRDKSQR